MACRVSLVHLACRDCRPFQMGRPARKPISFTGAGSSGTAGIDLTSGLWSPRAPGRQSDEFEVVGWVWKWCCYLSSLFLVI